MAYTTIDDPSAHFQALSYSGGSGSLARTFDGNSDLQPDLTWHKSTKSFGSSENFFGHKSAAVILLLSVLENLYVQPGPDAKLHFARV